MEKLSVLLFTYNNIKESKVLFSILNDVAQEFVVIDQSNQENKNMLISMAHQNHKIKIYNSVSFGFPEIIYMYGIKKCSNKWIFLVDIGEVPSKELVEKLLKFINQNIYCGFIIRRIDIIEKGSYEIWQPRLFQKNKVVTLGFLHDILKINGRSYLINNKKIYIKENMDYQTNMGKLKKYLTVESYTARLSYNDLIKISGGRSKILKKVVDFYIALFNKNSYFELNKNEYKVFNFLYLSYLYLFQKERISFKGIIFKNWYNNQKFNYFFKVPKKDRIYQMNLKNDIIKNGGLTSYLSLDDENVIKLLYKNKEISKMSGAERLILLLKYRHMFGKDYYKFLDRRLS